FLLSLADLERDTPDSIRRLGGEGGTGGRKVLPLVYITFTVAIATATTTTTADHRHHLQPPPRRRRALYATMRILQI
ncbi:hypothetical protein ALC53_04034, partial [Atta colombica]